MRDLGFRVPESWVRWVPERTRARCGTRRPRFLQRALSLKDGGRATLLVLIFVPDGLGKGFQSFFFFEGALEGLQFMAEHLVKI